MLCESRSHFQCRHADSRGVKLCGNFSDTSSLKFGTPPVQRPPKPPDHPLAFSVRLCLFLSASVQMLALAPLDTQPPRPWLRARVAAASGGGSIYRSELRRWRATSTLASRGKNGGISQKNIFSKKKKLGKVRGGVQAIAPLHSFGVFEFVPSWGTAFRSLRAGGSLATCVRRLRPLGWTSPAKGVVSVPNWNGSHDSRRCDMQPLQRAVELGLPNFPTVA